MIVELLKWLFLKWPLKRALTKLNKEVESDLEIQKGLADWEYHTKRVSKGLDDYCKKHPEYCK
jgi:hypothetical protein